MTILDDIIAYKREEVFRAKRNAPLSSLDAFARDAGPTRGFAHALARRAETSHALIAEIKKASPSKGVIRAEFDPAAHALAYEAGGAACLSVLTDAPSFQGDRAHLEAARAASRLPILRKDFFIDPYQAAEARAWGADCVLLIMACLSDEQADELMDAAHAYKLDALIETHNTQEFERALRLDSKLIGINNRNLNTFQTDLSVTERLAARAPKDRILVSESGIRTGADLERLRASGARAFLVGESLMRADDIAAATHALISGATVA